MEKIMWRHSVSCCVLCTHALCTILDSESNHFTLLLEKQLENLMYIHIGMELLVAWVGNFPHLKHTNDVTLLWLIQWRPQHSWTFRYSSYFVALEHFRLHVFVCIRNVVCDGWDAYTWKEWEMKYSFVWFTNRTNKIGKNEINDVQKTVLETTNEHT